MIPTSDSNHSQQEVRTAETVERGNANVIFFSPGDPENPANWPTVNAHFHRPQVIPPTLILDPEEEVVRRLNMSHYGLQHNLQFFSHEPRDHLSWRLFQDTG